MKQVSRSRSRESISKQFTAPEPEPRQNPLLQPWTAAYPNLLPFYHLDPDSMLLPSYWCGMGYRVQLFTLVRCLANYLSAMKPCKKNKRFLILILNLSLNNIVPTVRYGTFAVSEHDCGSYGTGTYFFYPPLTCLYVLLVRYLYGTK